MVDDLLAVSRRDVVSAAVVRNRENFVEQLVRLRFAARAPVPPAVPGEANLGENRGA
jgi:hypothetical protein